MPRPRALVVLTLSMALQAVWAQTPGEQVLAALERFRVAVLESDTERIVSSFTEDAQLAQGSEPVVQGRTTIRALWNAQRNLKVVSYELHAAATRVDGSTAVQNGVYSQRLISPQHDPTVTSGVFEVQWARQEDGSWLISRLQTDPVQ